MLKWLPFMEEDQNKGQGDDKVDLEENWNFETGRFESAVRWEN